MDKTIGIGKRTDRKTTAGAWVRSQFLTKAFSSVAWVCGTFGAGLGWMARDVAALAGVLEPGTTLLAVAVLVLSVMGAFAWYQTRVEKRWVTGLAAEKAVGDAIEHALTQEGCAYAHNIESLPGGGDIDHVAYVAGKTYVIETKAHRVPKKMYRTTLERLCDQARKVHHALGPEDDVQPVLVIAEDDAMNSESTGSVDGEQVLVTTRTRFAKRLRDERRRAQPKTVTECHRAEARKVWELAAARS